MKFVDIMNRLVGVVDVALSGLLVVIGILCLLFLPDAMAEYHSDPDHVWGLLLTTAICIACAFVLLRCGVFLLLHNRFGTPPGVIVLVTGWLIVAAHVVIAYVGKFLAGPFATDWPIAFGLGAIMGISMLATMAKSRSETGPVRREGV